MPFMLLKLKRIRRKKRKRGYNYLNNLSLEKSREFSVSRKLTTSKIDILNKYWTATLTHAPLLLDEVVTPVYESTCSCSLIDMAGRVCLQTAVGSS